MLFYIERLEERDGGGGGGLAVLLRCHYWRCQVPYSVDCMYYVLRCFTVVGREMMGDGWD